MHSPRPNTAIKACGKSDKNFEKFPFILYGSQTSFLHSVRVLDSDSPNWYFGSFPKEIVKSH